MTKSMGIVTLLVCGVLWPYVTAMEDVGRQSTQTEILFPAESDRHERTFMSWPEIDIWGRFIRGIQGDIARIAQAIVRFEPVTVLVSPNKYNEARRALSTEIELRRLPVNDLWARDTVPVFTLNMTSQDLIGVDFNFNGWGQKQRHEKDSQVARRLLRELNITRRQSSLVTEGGSLETDGAGTLLVTESSIINKNRNPGKSKAEIETELKAMLGVTKIIWFKGVAGKDITDAHVDSIARFVSPGRVIVTRPHPNSEGDNDVWTRASNQALRVLRSETDARGKKFEIIPLYEPDRDKIEIIGNPDTFVSTYVNFYVANRSVILPKFGDLEADEKAQQVLRNEFPNREIVAVKITTLASGGGGIHCATHELPYVAAPSTIASEV